MPARRNYVVTQEREVKVSAVSPIEAAQIANYAFNNDFMEGDQSTKPHITTEVREKSLEVREDY